LLDILVSVFYLGSINREPAYDERDGEEKSSQDEEGR